VFVVFRSHTAPEVCPGAVGAKVTVTEHEAPGASVSPVAQVRLTRYAAPVAGSMLTSVNDHG
jgi:hypothetical protein